MKVANEYACTISFGFQGQWALIQAYATRISLVYSIANALLSVEAIIALKQFLWMYLQKLKSWKIILKWIKTT